MMKSIKRDFNNVRLELSYLSNRNVPVGIALLYYIIAAPIGLLLYPFAKIWSKILLKKMDKEMKEWD